MRNPTPAPIVIPATGTPTCRGIYLGTHDLSEWRNDDRDAGLDADMVVKACADRATRDGAVLCLRPTAEGKGACVGMTPTAFAVASLADDFAARALVVDPYDAAGNDLREVLPESTPLTMTPEEAHMVAVWEGSERV
jgi:hypothetical protein